MKIERAILPDFDDIYLILRQGAVFLQECGVEQWTNGYPQKEVIMRDITNGYCHKVLECGKIIAAFSMIFGEEPTYKKIIGGSWLTEGNNYCTIHRIGVSDGNRGRGVASFIYSFVDEMCMKNAVASVRIDTHKDNMPQLRAFEKNGFKYCGIIFTDDGTERVAYEKILGRVR